MSTQNHEKNKRLAETEGALAWARELRPKGYWLKKFRGAHAENHTCACICAYCEKARFDLLDGYAKEALDGIREVAELARLRAFDSERSGQMVKATDFHEIAIKLERILDRAGGGTGVSGA